MAKIKVGDRVLQGKDGRFGYAECIEYFNSQDITVKFVNTGFVRKNVRADYFRIGRLKDYTAPTVWGIGILGIAELAESDVFAYRLWQSMLRRVVTDENSKGSISARLYADVTCSDDFLNFCKFRDWLYSLDNYDDAYTAWLHHGWVFNLDKDILYKGNRKYSAETCCLIPRTINVMMVIENHTDTYPVGVYPRGRDGALIAVARRGLLNSKSYRKSFFVDKCNDDVKNRDYWREIALKYYTHFDIDYKDEELAAIGAAWLDYKRAKEQYIRDVAELYRNYPTDDKNYFYHMIDERCYNALMNWQVEITD